MSQSELDKDIQKVNEINLRQQQVNQINDNYMMRKTRANLFMNQDTMIDYLASERFPNDPNAPFKYKINDQGDLLYWDDNVGNWAKEFPDLASYGLVGDKIVPNLVPATTFISDVAGGIAGAKKGFEMGLKKAAQGPKNPWAVGATILGYTAAGGATGNLMVGGINRYSRELVIDQFYNAPPEEMAAAIKDLGMSSLFSALPFGMGPTRKVVNKFLGRDDLLKMLVNLRTSTDEIIKESKKFGIELTPAEAGEIANKGIGIQHFLSAQPQINNIRSFYASRAQLTKQSIEEFANQIGSAKSVGDINTRIVNASQKTVDELIKKRKARSKVLYDYIKNYPGGIKVDGVEGLIKILDDKIAGVVRDEKTGSIINIEKTSPNSVKNYKNLKSLFYDADNKIIDDLSSLDQRRTSDMKVLINAARDSGSGDYGVMLGVTDKLTGLMDEAEPIYRLARRVYDPNKPSIMQIEKSAIGRFATMMTDKQTATAMKNLFDPNVSIKSLRNAKRILRVADPDLYKDVKKEYILQNLNRLNNPDLLEQGLPGFQKFMSNSNVNVMLKEMLEPDEFAQWSKMVDLMGVAFKRVPRGGSVTQPFGVMEEVIAKEAPNMSAKAINTSLAAIRFIPRLVTGQVGDDLMRGIAIEQRQAYMQKMADVLVDADAGKTMDEIYDVFNKYDYGLKQTMTRGAVEGFEEIVEDPERPYMGDGLPQETQQQDTENLQGSIDSFQMPQVQGNMFEAPKPTLAPQQMMSPTILPNEDDREIAMRRQTGIAGLV